jgi:hypothetical protein
MNSKLIAPCGMNCAICLAYLREENRCLGCRAIVKDKPVTRINCKIKNCEIIRKNNWKYCSIRCKEFPCDRLNTLDKRYRTKYGMSMIANLQNIDKKGIRKFIRMEKDRWIKGNKVFCVHNKTYFKIT